MTTPTSVRAVFRWSALGGALFPMTAEAQSIGTWSTDRSPFAIATSDHFDDLRTAMVRVLPNAQFVPLRSLPATLLSQLDVLILDAQGPTPLTADEQAALHQFVARGGLLVAQGVGPMGASLGAPFGVSATAVHDGPEPHEDTVPAGVADGPFGRVTRYTNRYDGHLTTTTVGAVLVGDAAGAHLISMTVGEGRAVFFGNLFAFADADLAPGGLLATADNAVLIENLVAQALPSPRIGTWSTSRSKVGFARSDAFRLAREQLTARLPGARMVELPTLDPRGLKGVDVLVLDSTLEEPLTIDEFDALSAFVRAGGSVAAQLYGPMGNAIGGLYGLAVRGKADASVRTYGVHSEAGGPLSGPFGSVSTYENRYEVYIAGKGTANDGLPLVEDSGGVRVVYVPRTERHGSALLYTNLFAFGDADWSVGGLAAGANDNLRLLGNFLAQSDSRKTPTTPLASVVTSRPEAPEWQAAYRDAARSAVNGELGSLKDWLAQYRDTSPNGLVLRTAGWLEAPQHDADPRFFPVEGIVLGTSTRKDLLAAGHQPDDVSKWTFEVGELGWTCLDGPKDHCYEVRADEDLPPSWGALALAPDLAPEQLAQTFEGLGYQTTIGVASVSPFGREVVARGFGVLWQADYTPAYRGEEMLGLTARHVAW